MWLTLSGSPPQGGESRPTARSDFALRHAFAISPRIFARVLRSNLPPRDQRAQGIPGARCARSLVCKIRKHTSIVTTVTPDSPGIPRAMVYGLYRALPGDRAFLPPSPCEKTSARLDISVGISGPHDFAVRGATSLVADIARVHRIPHPTSVTIAQTPLMRGTGYCRYGFDLGVRSMPPVAADWHDGQFAHDKHAIADHRAG